MKKKNTWNIRHLVNELFVQSAQRTSVLYYILTDFKLSIYLTFFLYISLVQCRHMARLETNEFWDWYFQFPWLRTVLRNLRAAFLLFLLLFREIYIRVNSRFEIQFDNVDHCTDVKPVHEILALCEFHYCEFDYRDFSKLSKYLAFFGQYISLLRFLQLAYRISSLE